MRIHLGVKLVVLAGFLLAFTGACVQQNNTYPLDIFRDMHYSQSFRNSEPDRLDPVANAVAIDSYGEALSDPDQVLDIDAVRSVWIDGYTPTEGATLYNTYCSACHGVSGLGDGPVSAHFTNSESYYVVATNQGVGEPYIGPADLQQTRINLPKEASFITIFSGRNGMPNFKHLSEQTIRTIVEYVYDETSGLGSGQGS